MKINILIVEDEKEIREGVSEYLSEVGYNVISAEDGMQAIELFKNSKIDLVILDIMLPKANGFVVLNKIRQESNVPVIMLTAMSDDYTQIMSFDEKADDYITKPFSIIVLHKRIEALLRRGVKLEENRKWNYKDIEIIESKANFITLIFKDEKIMNEVYENLKDLAGIQKFNEIVPFIKIWVNNELFSHEVIKRVKETLQ